MNKTFEYDRNSCMLSSLANRPVCSCKSSTVVVLQMKTATCRWQRKRRWSQYINSSSCNDLQKNTIDALQKSKKNGESGTIYSFQSSSIIWSHLLRDCGKFNRDSVEFFMITFPLESNMLFSW